LIFWIWYNVGMKKGVKKTTEKYVTESTFEKHMANIAKSFERVNASLERHEQVMQVMLKEITAIHEDTKSFRDNISTLYTDHVAYDRKIENLNVRVEKLELKSK